MRKHLVIFLVLVLTACSTTSSNIKTEQLATPDEVAKVKIKPNVDLPIPLDLQSYKLDETKTKQYVENGEVYIAIPEKDVQLQQELLLTLKIRIQELQRILENTKKLL